MSNCDGINNGGEINLNKDTIHVSSNPETVSISVNDSDDQGCFFSASITFESHEWSGNVIKYGDDYYLFNPDGNNGPNDFEGIATKGGPKRIKKIGTKNTSATIADPGFHFILDFSEWESELPQTINKIKAKITIGLLDGDDLALQAEMWYTMDAGEREIDILSKPMKILVPFVDEDWDEEEHDTKDLRYKIDIFLNGDEYKDEGSRLHKTFHIEDKFVKEEKHKGPFVSGYLKSHMPEGKPWEYHEGGVSLKNVIYTEDGVWFNIDYDRDSPTATYLMRREDGSSSNFVPFQNTDGETKVDSFEAVYLPYPRVKDGNTPISDCFIRVAYQGKNFDFPPKSKDLYKHHFLITGSESPQNISVASNDVTNNDSHDDTSRGIEEVASDIIQEQEEAITNILTKTIKRFKNLFS